MYPVAARLAKAVPGKAKKSVPPMRNVSMERNMVMFRVLVGAGIGSVVSSGFTSGLRLGAAGQAEGEHGANERGEGDFLHCLPSLWSVTRVYCLLP
ncbi:hypothetical protein D3C72_2137260 [compost metagenome]